MSEVRDRKRLWLEMLTVLIMIVPPLIVSSIIALHEPEIPAPQFEILNTTAYSISILAPLLYIMWTSGDGWRRFGIVKPKRQDLLWGVLIFLIDGAFHSFFSGLWVGTGQATETAAGTAMVEHLQSTAEASIPMLVFTLFLNSIVEEFSMRAYLITRLEELIKPKALIVPLAAVPFALYHAYQGPYGVLGVYLFGLVAGFFFFRLRSVWPLVLAHTAMNLWISLAYF